MDKDYILSFTTLAWVYNWIFVIIWRGLQKPGVKADYSRTLQRWKIVPLWPNRESPCTLKDFCHYGRFNQVVRVSVLIFSALFFCRVEDPKWHTRFHRRCQDGVTALSRIRKVAGGRKLHEEAEWTVRLGERLEVEDTWQLRRRLKWNVTGLCSWCGFE